MSVHAKYTPSNGGLAEQFDRNTGSPTSAADLTWSYAAAWTGFNARSSAAKTKSWGAKGLSVSSTCVGNTGPTVQVTFDVQATTFFGGKLYERPFDLNLPNLGVLDNIFITGSVDALKTWSPDNAIALSAATYPIWSGERLVLLSLCAFADLIYYSHRHSSCQCEYRVQVHSEGPEWSRHMGV